MSKDMSLAAKIAAASRAVGPLATDKHNPQGNYDYISADKMLERCGQALADVGVAVVPAVTSIEVSLGSTAGNKPRFDVTVNFEISVTDGAESLLCAWIGMGSDYSVPDKATYKAITSGHKYFLAKLLNVGVGNEDGEHEPAEPAAPVQQAQRKQQARAPQTRAPQTGTQDDVDYGGVGQASDNPFDDPDLLDIAARLSQTQGFPTPVVGKLAERLRAKDAESKGQMTEKQYQFISGLIDQTCDSKDAHGIVLSYLLGRKINGANRPGFEVKVLIDYINPKADTFDQATANLITYTYSHIEETLGEGGYNG